MKTETQIVKELIRRIRAKRLGDVDVRCRLREVVARELHNNRIPGPFDLSTRRREREDMSARLERRIRKKLAQPFRRKKRGPLRKRAAGKNEVTRRV